MMNLAKYFKQRRLEMGLTLGTLSRLIKYANTNKGSNRTHEFE